MICQSSNNVENQPTNDPDIDGLTSNHRLDLISDLPDNEMDLLNEFQEEEIELDISIDDSSVIWDLRQLFDLDILPRDISPFPRGDSTDIPSEIMRSVTPSHGDGCLDENNMNAKQQTNQNNIQGESKRSNTCLKSLTRAIHDSDQVKDILFGTGNKEKSPTQNTFSSLPLNRQKWPDNIDGDKSMDSSDLSNRIVNTSNIKDVYKLQKDKKSRNQRHKYDYSSSSDSSSNSSCSCSNRKYKRRKRCHPPICHHNESICQHPCVDVRPNNNCLLSNCSYMTPESNQNQCNSNTSSFPPLNDYMTPKYPWQMPYMSELGYNHMYSQPYVPMCFYEEPSNYSSPDMSDIIERIHKLDISINNLTKDTYQYLDADDHHRPPLNNYYNDYIMNH